MNEDGSPLCESMDWKQQLKAIKRRNREILVSALFAYRAPGFPDIMVGLTMVLTSVIVPPFPGVTAPVARLVDLPHS